MTRDQRLVTEYLLAENKVIRQQLRGRRIRYTDAQRRRLALAATRLGRKALLRMDTLVTPDTLLRWYRRLVAKKYDSSGCGRSRPRTSWSSCYGWQGTTAGGATRVFEAR